MFPIFNGMNIRKGDNVMMIAGKDLGKKGKVLSVLPKSSRVIVEGLNMIKRHLRPRKQGQKGQILSKERAVDISNVQLICPKCGKTTRLGHRSEGSLKFRICKKCGSDI